MGKIVKKKITYKILMLLAIAALIAISIPVIYLGRYDVPSADDYSYSTDTYHAVISGESVIKGAFNTVKRVYLTWQGTYSASFMMSLQPGIFSFSSYSLTPLIMLISLSVGILFLIKTVFAYLGCTYKEKPVIISVILIIICTQFIPSPVQGLYWYNGSIYYTFFFALALIEFSLFFRHLISGKNTSLITASLLAFIIGGSNFSSALMCCVVNFGIVFIGFLRKNNNWKKLMIPSVICVAGLLISCFAPGNSVRQADYTSHPSAVEAVISSVVTLPSLIASWPNLIVLGMLILLFPICIDSAREMTFTIKYPFLYSIASYLILSVMICPTEYVFGSFGPPRMVNTVFFAYIILLAVNELIWVRYFTQKKEIFNDTNGTCTVNFLFAGFSFCLLLFISVFLFNTSLTSIAAVSEIRSGEAETYYSEALKRQDIFDSSSGQDITISQYSVKPYLLFFDDFSEDKDNWKNIDACTYFGINSIVCK